MNLNDLIGRNPSPAPWAEGSKIPWDEPGFSRRMLAEHLSQAHDAASRRSGLIDQHVDWIQRHLLAGQPGRILDLGCGPGLYTSRLARLGHTCLGLDFSPASIAYSTDTARTEGLRCAYRQEDLRRADYGAGYQLVMLIFGEFNVFPPGEARQILAKAHQALAPGGLCLLEVSTEAAVRQMGQGPATWYSTPSGLFSDQPHLCLYEPTWDAEQRVATQRYFIVEARSGEVTRYASSSQAYSETEYRAILEQAGFQSVQLGDASPEGATWPGEYLLIVARKWGVQLNAPRRIGNW